MEQHSRMVKIYNPGRVLVVKAEEGEDPESMIIDHAISDEAEDRDGDVILLDAWETANFLQNPVVLDAHSQEAPPIGRCIELYKDGSQLRAKTQFAPTERGKMYYELYKNGFMRAFSVGFVPMQTEARGDKGYLIKSCELLEYSCVSVPANPRALKQALAKLQEPEVEKRGAVINKSNMDKLRQMQQLLNEILESAERETEEDPEPEGEEDVPETLENILLGGLTKEQEEA